MPVSSFGTGRNVQCH
ncbi:Protein of unknown function [Pyronema omphalodes CBS 100304]|uniref:Uncharacterized protein n=1 Tax=Pyronema omphalodes (strain CBS 100304) TaxID=1076935 RepID=U4LCA8_PYROM|nr:Protein of unknown function [Pyronema omphalodes CBS 100304]